MKIFKRMLSVFLATVIILSVLCAGTMSAGAVGENLTVDGFYNQDNEYCIRVDGLTSKQMFSLDLYTTNDNYITLIELELRTGKDKYYFRITNDLIGGYETNYIDFSENGKAVDIDLDGRFYSNTNPDGSSTCGYVIFVPKDSKYIEKLTSCTAASVGVGLLEFGTQKKIGLDEGYKLYSMKPSFATVKAVSENDISTLEISKIKNQTYTGKNRKPAITIKDGDKTLEKGKDYTVSYKNCKKVGIATATIKGKGDYTGEKTIEYKIVPKKTSLKVTKSSDKKATFKWNKVSGAEKYEIYYSTDGGKKYKKLTTVSGSKTSYTSTKLNFKKYDYKFKIRSYGTSGETKCYSSYSSVKTVK